MSSLHCQCSWTLKEAMSHSSEQDSKINKSSQEDMEYHSKSDSELEEGSTALEEDMFLSIQYPSPPNFPKPYLHNQDFTDSNQALKYITKHFNFKLISKNLKSYRNLSHEYSSTTTLLSTRIDSHHSNVILTNQYLIKMPSYKNG